MAPVAHMTNIQSFCAAHRLHNPDMSDEENKKHFGRCNHPSSHGHNYKVEATVKGEIIPKFGYAMNLVDLKNMMLQVVDPLDHKRLDTDIEFFQNNIASAENIAVYIWQELEKKLPQNVELHKIRVHETEKNIIEYMG